jgi:integrase
VKPQLPDGCFKLLFQRFKASTEFTDLAENTKKEYARHMRHVEPVLGFHPVAAFTADFMDRLIGKFAKNPTLQKAIRRTMSVLLGYAVRILQWIPANPLLNVQKVRRRGRQEACVRMPLSEPAIARFRAANPYGSRARLVFELGLTSAFRREDLARVPAEDIEAGEIPFRTGKAGTLVVASVTEHLVRAFRAFRARHPEHATAFYALGAQKNGKPIHKRTISTDFEAAAKLAGFTMHERLHALRYTAATRLFELGLHYDDIARVTGHAMAAMARHYCKLRKDAPKRGEMLAAFGDDPYRPGTPLDGTPAGGAEPREAAGGGEEASASKTNGGRDASVPGSCPPDSAGASSRRSLWASREPVVVTMAGTGKSAPRSRRASTPASDRSPRGQRNTFLVGAHAREGSG